MIKLDYLRTVQELCEQVGIDTRSSVADTQHLEVDGVTIGLLYDEDIAPNTLGLYIDLGAVHDAETRMRLLEYNAFLQPESAAAGHFAILPGAGSVAYRVNTPFTASIGGETLATIITDCLQSARNSFDSVAVPS